jgi:hypothetical protein
VRDRFPWLRKALVPDVPDERALPVLVSRKVFLPVVREEAPAPVGRMAPALFPRSDRTFFVNSGEAEATFVRDAQDRVIKVILKQGGARIDAPRLEEN